MDTNEAVFEKIKALKKDKYTMKDVDTFCDLLGIELLQYQKLIFLLHLNIEDSRKNFFEKKFLKTLDKRN